MALPNPLPDNPARWDGWKNYNSDDLYSRLCLSIDSVPTAEEIEENCRQLLVWWQKKLPLKNQPSNPIAQLLRGGLDEAPHLLAEARTKLLDPAQRAAHDTELRKQMVRGALEDFRKLLPFAIVNGKLSTESEQRLFEAGAELGLLKPVINAAVDAELRRVGAERGDTPPVVITVPAPTSSPSPVVEQGTNEARNPFDEFRRMLKLSRLCRDGEDMTDDQRDALCNMGEGLGLTGGQAEDLIDEYLEEMASAPSDSPGPVAQRPVSMASVSSRPPAASPPIRPAAVSSTVRSPVTPSAKPVSTAPAAAPKPKEVGGPVINTSPVARALERSKYPNFRNSVGCEMVLVPSGEFLMGSDSPEAAPHEQPPVQTIVGCFYIARFPITNAQYECFDPAHRSRRAPWADDLHPVVYVNSKEAMAFCQWLSAKEGRKYRLPTEAEWEYAARGMDNRVYPWGSRLDAGHLANFADRRTSFAWRDANIDDGWAETSPVGTYPRGASPFGIEDMAGNVFEWCLDFFEAYRPRNRVNPRGPMTGAKRIYRGGSWKSRAASLRASARAFNAPEYSSNDVGFRIICECAG